MQYLDPFLNQFLAVMAIAYAALAVRVSRIGPHHANNIIGISMLLIAGLIASSVFTYRAENAELYNVGNVLGFTSAAFLPLAYFILYREFTIGPPTRLQRSVLMGVPLLITIVALTNPLHGLLWETVVAADGTVHGTRSDPNFYHYIYRPYVYGLFSYTTIAMIARLPTVASANRRALVLMLVFANAPFVANIASIFVNMGAQGMRLTAMSLALMWPAFVYMCFKMRVYELSPLAYKTLFDHVRDPIFVLDNDQCILCANRAAQELLKAKELDLVGRQLWEEFPAARAILEQARELDLTQTLRMDTENIYEVSVGPLRGAKGHSTGMVVVCRDVTQRRKALSKLAESEHLVRSLIETSSNGILRFSRDEQDTERRFRCVFANRSAELFCDDKQGSLVGMPLDKLEFLGPEKLYDHFGGEQPATSQLSFEVSAEEHRGGGWLRIVGEPVGADFSLTLVDITQRKQTEDKMLADALRDPLTGILNRRGFEQGATACIRENKLGAVLYLDLNAFKSVNDQFGHQAGDALLKAFGHRLGFCLRPEDILGRLGGDEFAVVMPGVDIDDVQHIAERLVQTASEAYIIQGQQIECTVSVGIALMPKHGEELWHLISVADQAMYTAKGISADEAANDRAAYIEAATAS